MQTFLPYPDFSQSAACLDDKRLGKQRSEALTLLRGYWVHHPASKMWKGYHRALADYGIEVCKAWVKRGFKDSCMDEFIIYALFRTENTGLPPWLGDPKFHLAHQSNLVRKDPKHYRVYFPNVPDDLPYIWPS